MFILIWTTLLFSVRGSDGKGQTQATTGGFQTTMTLTAPGFCSGSHHEIVCFWTDNQTPVVQKHNLTLNLSVEHHGTSLTCSTRCANSANTGKPEPQNVPCPVCTSAGEVLLSNATDESDNSTATGKNQTLEIKTLEDFFTMLLDNVKQPQVIIAFCTGIILSAFICCLTRTCHRKKPKTSENMVETLEMVSTQALPLMDGGQSLENDGALVEAAEGAEAKEVEYSDIDHYRLSRKNPGEAEDDVQKTAETEYAEIKREAAEQRQEDGEQEDGEQEDGEQEDGEQEGEAMEGEEAKEAEGDEEEQQVVEEELPVFEDHEATGE